MSSKPNQLPENEELLARIHSNLLRAQGFLDQLLNEIEDPDLKGPGASREEWRRLALEVKAKMLSLEAILTPADKDSLND